MQDCTQNKKSPAGVVEDGPETECLELLEAAPDLEAEEVVFVEVEAG